MLEVLRNDEDAIEHGKRMWQDYYFIQHVPYVLIIFLNYIMGGGRTKYPYKMLFGFHTTLHY
jgi:hypothetical protein